MDKLGGDEMTKVGVCGDSAGAMISASICHTVKDLDFQVGYYS
jgi:acetyl esterase/lipase